jgi:hypothetical protein
MYDQYQMSTKDIPTTTDCSMINRSDIKIVKTIL